MWIVHLLLDPCPAVVAAAALALVHCLEPVEALLLEVETVVEGLELLEVDHQLVLQVRAEHNFHPGDKSETSSLIDSYFCYIGYAL